jgi:hypothetical protein
MPRWGQTGQPACERLEPTRTDLGSPVRLIACGARHSACVTGTRRGLTCRLVFLCAPSPLRLLDRGWARVGGRRDTLGTGARRRCLEAAGAGCPARMEAAIFRLEPLPPPGYGRMCVCMGPQHIWSASTFVFFFFRLRFRSLYWAAM